jgi:predicted RND superfamily exporter protein
MAAERLAGFALHHRRRILLVAFAILVAALCGATRIRVGSEYIGNFRRDAPVRMHYQAVNEVLGGANPFYVVVESHVDGAFADPTFLAELEALQTWLELQPEIGSTISVVDHLKLIHRSFHEGRPEQFRIPDDRDLAKQLLVFGGGEEIERYVDSRFRTANVVVRARVEDTASISALVEAGRWSASRPPSWWSTWC